MQRGSLVKVARKNGLDVWQFRWSEKGGDGRRVYRKRVIGTIEQYSDAAAAQQLAARIIARPKSLVSRPAPPMTIAELCEHFQHRELSQSDAFRSHSTRRNYIFYLNKWIIPRWKDYELADVRTVEVEACATQPAACQKHLREDSKPDVCCLQSRLPVRLFRPQPYFVGSTKREEAEGSERPHAC
jgi:hypothetical protein